MQVVLVDSVGCCDQNDRQGDHPDQEQADSGFAGEW